MPMPPTLPQKWAIPGSEDVRLGRFGSQRLDHPVVHLRRHSILRELNSAVSSTYDFSSCFFPKFKIMHFQNRDIKLYTVVLLFLCFLKFLLKLCCR